MMRPKDLRQGSGTKTFLDAMHSGKVHLARFILDALDGRIINSKTENSRTPLMFAVRLLDPGARAKFTRLLLEKGADVNYQDEDGRTALSHACEMGHLDTVKLLVQFSADPDIADAWGNGALMYAAFSGHGLVLDFLIRAFKRLGLRLDRTNNAGHSAVQVADFFGHNQCVQILNFPGRRSLGTDDPLVDLASEEGGECPLPKRLPRHVLERFSKQFHSKNEEQLPAVFQRQLKVGDSNGLWNRFPCSRSQSAEQTNHPQHLVRSHTEGDRDVLFTAKQLQNCKLRDPRGAKMLNPLPEPSRKDASQDRGLKQGMPESFPLWGKAKSFNLDLLSGRKQSYQGDMLDMSLSASKLKRASLQDERSLMDKIECQGNTCGLTAEADKIVIAPKALLNSNSQSARAPEENAGSQRDESNGAASPSHRREQQKRGSLPPPPGSRHCKLLPARGELEPGRIPIAPPGFTGLGTRLLRRLTAPEFMRMVIECSSSSSSSSSSSHGRGKMSRSETFPFSHQQVNSQQSVDSISGVKCEFESSCSRASLD